ncbi:hypothetical protein IT087_03465 [Candidatus Uhrbacteria bacterium]|nr:hypothetical protein [Candidatus Uhrbacteria bacterium]
MPAVWLMVGFLALVGLVVTCDWVVGKMRVISNFLVWLFTWAVKLAGTSLSEAVPTSPIPTTNPPPPKPTPVSFNPFRSEEDRDLAELEQLEHSIDRSQQRRTELIARIQARKTPRSLLVDASGRNKPS